MVFNIINNNTNIYGGLNKNKVIEGKSINNFNGHLDYLGTNLLNYELGELMYSRNMEWFSSGNTKFLRTKRGSTLYKDITANSLGSGVFYDDGDSYFFWIDSSGNLKYLDSDKEIQTLKTGLDTTYTHEFWFYGLNGNETLYFCNKTDGWSKVTLSGSTFSYTLVSSTGFDSMSFSKISGRMILTTGHNAINSTSISTPLLSQLVLLSLQYLTIITNSIVTIILIIINPIIPIIYTFGYLFFNCFSNSFSSFSLIFFLCS